LVITTPGGITLTLEPEEMAAVLVSGEMEVLASGDLDDVIGSLSSGFFDDMQFPILFDGID
jgi:hypothetical protein